MTEKEYGRYLHSLYLKEEISFGEAIEKAMAYKKDRIIEHVALYLKVNLAPFDYCIGHTEHNEIVMNTEKFIEELKKHLGYYGE